MTDKNEEPRHENSPEMGEDDPHHQTSATPGEPRDQNQSSEGNAASEFTAEQLAQLQDLIASQGRPQSKGWLRGWLARGLDRGRSFVHAATPPDEETDFDQETVTGRLASRASKHRGLAALAAVMAVLVIGGFWSMILGGGLPLPVVAGIVVAVLVSGLVFGLVLRRRNP